MSDVEANIEAAGFKLPESAPPLFNYVPYVIAGNIVFVAGQVPIGGEQDFKGKVGTDVDMDTAKAAAEQCALNILTQIKDAVGGDWSKVKRCRAISCHQWRFRPDGHSAGRSQRQTRQIRRGRTVTTRKLYCGD